MLFLSLLDRKQQSGAASAHLRVLPGVMASLCEPREPQPAAPHHPSLTSGRVGACSSEQSRPAGELPHAPPLPWGTWGRWEQSSALLPCPSDTRPAHGVRSGSGHHSLQAAPSGSALCRSIASEERPVHSSWSLLHPRQSTHNGQCVLSPAETPGSNPQAELAWPETSQNSLGPKIFSIG